MRKKAFTGGFFEEVRDMRNLILIVEGFILAVIGVRLAFNIRIGEEFDGLI